MEAQLVASAVPDMAVEDILGTAVVGSPGTAVLGTAVLGMAVLGMVAADTPGTVASDKVVVAALGMAVVDSLDFDIGC